VFADVVDIPDDKDAAERMKSILANCAGRLACQYKEFKCKNPYKGADAGVMVQSCAYNQVAVITTLLALLLPRGSFDEEQMSVYPHWLAVHGDSDGDLVNTYADG
jgi:hypothetical protein